MTCRLKFVNWPRKITTFGKKNPRNPGLRFKQIHDTMPVFSFRVGMRHRTVDIETDDAKIVWFWVRSFEAFKAQIGGSD